jgi:hypothetical protein
MRISMRAVSLVPVVLALVVVCAVAGSAFGSGAGAGDGKADSAVVAAAKSSAAAAFSAARPDRDRKVYTNDDLERMWPKSAAPSATVAARASERGASAEDSRSVRAVAVVVSPERDPVWYAQQLVALTSELDGLAAREERLRAFRKTGDAAGLRVGLGIYAPCEGISTDNEIQQLALRREEIQAQIAGLEDMAQRYDLEPGVVRDAPAILAASEKPLTASEERAASEERQARLAAELDATRGELEGMAAEAAGQRAVLLQPAAGWGGNMTTDLIETLDRRAGEIQGELEQ